MAPRKPAPKQDALQRLNDVFLAWFLRVLDRDLASASFNQALADSEIVMLRAEGGKLHGLKKPRIELADVGVTVGKVFDGDMPQVGPFLVGKPEDMAQEPEIATATTDDSKPPPRPRGPAQKHDWLAICAEIACRCVDKQGRVSVPKSARDLTKKMLKWCSAERGIKEPAHSEMAAAVKAISDALRKMQK